MVERRGGDNAVAALFGLTDPQVAIEPGACNRSSAQASLDAMQQGQRIHNHVIHMGDLV